MLVVSVLVAPKFLSIIVIQFSPSQLIDINHKSALWYTQDVRTRGEYLVHVSSGHTHVSLNGRIGKPYERYMLSKLIDVVHQVIYLEDDT